MLDPMIFRNCHPGSSFVAVAAVIDFHPFNPLKLQRRLESAWILKGSFSVKEKKDCFYVQFDNIDDLRYVVQGGPWTVDNSLLVVDYW